MSAPEPAVTPPVKALPPRWYLVGIVAIFAVGLALPLLGWAVDIDRPLELAENRTPAPRPHRPRSWTDVADFPKALETYWNDAFGFRRRLIRGQAIVRYCLGLSSDGGVIIGRKGWLFYAGDLSVEQHRGLRLLSADELASWQRHLEARRAWAQSLGAHYLFVVAPDKQSVYPDDLPARFTNGEKTLLDQLLDHLAAHSSVDVLDLRAPLRAASREGPVYALTDTHWNDFGAYVAYRAIRGRLSTWYPQLRARPLSDFSVTESARWSGDLAEMLGLGGFLGERDRQLAPRSSVVIQTPSASAGGPRVVVFHDSFFLTPEERRLGLPARPWSYPSSPAFHFTPLLAEGFSSALFRWQYPFDPELIKREHPDVVIEERVERLLTRGPQGPMPPAP